MAANIEITCPCCESLIVVDRVTGEILLHKKKESKSGLSLEAMVANLDSQKSELAKKFDKNMESQKDPHSRGALQGGAEEGGVDGREVRQSDGHGLMAFDPDAAAAEGSGIYGLPHTAEEARVVVVPVPFEATTSYGRGTSAGPRAI